MKKEPKKLPEIVIDLRPLKDGNADLRFRFEKSPEFGKALAACAALNPRIRERIVDLGQWLLDVAELGEGVEKVRATKKPKDRFF